MNQNLQIVKVLVGCTAERGTVAAEAAAVGDTVSLDGWDG